VGSRSLFRGTNQDHGLGQHQDTLHLVHHRVQLIPLETHDCCIDRAVVVVTPFHQETRLIHLEIYLDRIVRGVWTRLVQRRDQRMHLQRRIDQLAGMTVASPLVRALTVQHQNVHLDFIHIPI